MTDGTLENKLPKFKTIFKRLRKENLTEFYNYRCFLAKQYCFLPNNIFV